LVLGSLGDKEGSRTYAARAVLAHPEDPRVHYYSAYLDADAGRLETAARSLETSLRLRPGYAPARSLLASVRYRSNRFEDAARLADEAIAADRGDSAAWYLKGMSYVRLGRPYDGRSVFAAALSMNPSDEFLRVALEDLLLTTTPIESPDRIPWAGWHFSRARDYLSRNLSDQAMFEYRRGLRLNPYAAERRNYAELLRLQGYPSRHLDELRFMQELGKADRAVNDAVESYDSLLYDALHRIWRIDPIQVVGRHWKVAILSIPTQSGSVHPDAGAVAASYLRDLLAHEGNMQSVDVELRQSNFSSAFRAAREAGADYFMIVGVSESGRDLSMKGELYVARTGSPAESFASYRTGEDRLRNASRGIVEKLAAVLPFRARLIRRNAGSALIDKGKMDKVVLGNTYEIIRRGVLSVKNEGIGLVYSPEDVVGTLAIDGVDEQVSSGVLTRKGFFDRIALGDDVILVPAKGQDGKSGTLGETAVDPELRNLLRTLR
jgi:tetratricopeptide (TPR) repeat protein